MIGARGRPQEFVPAVSLNLERLSVVRSSRATFPVELAPRAVPAGSTSVALPSGGGASALLLREFGR
jgi:hypothetical protein